MDRTKQESKTRPILSGPLLQETRWGKKPYYQCLFFLILIIALEFIPINYKRRTNLKET